MIHEVARLKDYPTEGKTRRELPYAVQNINCLSVLQTEGPFVLFRDGKASIIKQHTLFGFDYRCHANEQ